ncbi:hypothetical protein ACXR2U_04300 [Jatrophihabitans sp. YIM 134969]
MATLAHEGVEFLDPVVDMRGGPGTEPAPDAGDDAPQRPGPRWRAVVAALVVVGGLLAAARVVGAPPPVAPAVATEAPVFAGHVALPADFGSPVQIVAAAARSEDVVWVLGSGGQLARVVDGVVATVTVERGYGAVAVRPDARGVFVTTGRFAPVVVALDPLTLEARGQAPAAAPVTALAAGVGSVWAATSSGVQGWTTDLRRALRPMVVPVEVTSVRSLAVVGARLQAVVATTPGVSALLRLEPPGGGARLTSTFRDPVSVVPGIPALVAHVGARGAVEVAPDPSDPSAATPRRPLPADATLWPGPVPGSGTWMVATPTSATLDCFDAAGDLVGRMTVGDRGRGITGPVATTRRAVYAATADGRLSRGGHGSCHG